MVAYYGIRALNKMSRLTSESESETEQTKLDKKLKDEFTNYEPVN